MLDYILSKLNMLILVTALFAIGSYFAFYLAQSLEKQQADTVLSQITEDAFGVINSSSICHEVTLTLPPYINTLGRSEGGNKLYYLFQINSQENVLADLSTDPANALIFSIRTKKDNQVLSAQRIVTNAHIQIFEWDARSGTTDPLTALKIPVPDALGNIFVTLNPVAAPTPPENAVKLVKEVYNGETYLYVIPCSSRVHQCETNYGYAVARIKSTRLGGVYNC
ncbi:MAG: hypothetical protein J4215_02540 [Candidatus Diapherotrites archaeon]|uniref:Uncharacterized protein n=1 Tax=Candidatus Iainarchaeum sp. TaxID=3101447 RepID=A0A8T4L284_9ARCH|nr:hypothetical protein [Candidatus Diapherotrites archaeon]